MMTAVLTMAVLWCLFYGRMPVAVLFPFCLGLGVAVAFLNRHKHSRFFSIDVWAQMSRLNQVNPSLKLVTVLVLMAVCIAARSPMVGLFLTGVMGGLTVGAGGLNVRHYVCLLALPVSFIMLSGLALLFDVTARSGGILSFPVFGFWLCVSADNQVYTALITARALGAVSCLYLLSLTTPMADVIGVLRRARCPGVLIDLMYLIYRSVFMLLSMYHIMKDAAASRLGFAGYRVSVRTTGKLYSQLLLRSYRQANRNFDAMESRCYDTHIRFLEHRVKVTGVQAGAAAGLIAVTVGLFLWLR